MAKSYIDRMRDSTHLSGGSASYVEDMYEQFIENKDSVPIEWHQYFQCLDDQNSYQQQQISHKKIKQEFISLAMNPVKTPQAKNNNVSFEHETKQVALLELIDAYRVRGHQQANLDPLELMERHYVEDLTLEYHGLSQADLNTSFQSQSVYFGKQQTKLNEIIAQLKQTYCASIGAEFMHIINSEQRRWFQERLESELSCPELKKEQKLHLHDRLTAAEGLEKYLGAKYPGTKRFGLEGAESLIVSLDEVIQKAGTYGVKEIVIGMAHRGRINVLINTLGKKVSELVDEFDGTAEYQMGSGDVKYHQGFSSNVMTPGGEVHLALAFNPSHLEIVAPVVEGSVRARQDKRKDESGTSVLPIILHGDAAFSGQGVVMETFQMSQTRAYKTGGTIHIVINNQVGFTTNKKEDARSTEYCTDVAKVVDAPILHVNADDPEAVLFVSQLAIDYRYQFNKDIVIDLVCYRRRGHNEADEPFGTQPLMYGSIKKLATTLTQYTQKLVAQNIISNDSSSQLANQYRDDFVRGKSVVKDLVSNPDSSLFFDWSPYLGHDWQTLGDTSFNEKDLATLAEQVCDLPPDFNLQRQVQKMLNDRKLMITDDLPINWGFAETLAYASLLKQGFSIRLTGQDVGRGTFSHRHAAVHDQKSGETFVPLQNLKGVEKRFSIYDSFLSELAVVGFEYGYSTTNPNTMVIWEAQFGDFANGAQMIIDQFVTSGEHKWGRLSGLTMLLPHGYEGQGPEHSSARLERFLQMCAEHNIQVCVPTTPAQIFHLLRRQMRRPLRRPLIVMSPKSLLRHKQATSTMTELANGCFQNVIAEKETIPKSNITRLVLCSGRVYFDLLEAREKQKLEHIAIIRIEQLYPFPEEDLIAAINGFTQISKVVWCQEEPMNQGAWYSTQHHLREAARTIDSNLYLEFAGRPASAAPAAGYMALHLIQLENLLRQALIE